MLNIIIINKDLIIIIISDHTSLCISQFNYLNTIGYPVDILMIKL